MKKFLIFSLVVAVVVITLAVGFGNAEAKDKVYKWDMTYPLYRGTWDWAVLEKWCAHLKAASGGRLDITPHAGGEIMPVMETFDAVSSIRSSRRVEPSSTVKAARTSQTRRLRIARRRRIR